MLTILIKILVIFAMIFVGLFANKRGILPAESNKYLVDPFNPDYIACDDSSRYGNRNT